MSKAHQIVTDRILETMRAGTLPWVRPWTPSATANGLPYSAASRRPYSGANVCLLWASQQVYQYPTQGWVTYNQANEAGAQVRKGEKATPVVYVSTIERETDDGKVQKIPFLKSYSVFNVAQCDGAEKLYVPTIEPRAPEARDAIAEAFLSDTGADIRHGEGRAYYRPAGDFIVLPDFNTFADASGYYATAFHELGHWTGAATRLQRDFSGRFGSQSYAAEELVAELTAAFLCAEFQFDAISQHAAYLDSWIKLLEHEPSAFVTAAARASNAAAYLRGLALRSDAIAA